MYWLPRFKVAVLLEGLLAANKIRDGARVIYSHSETTRSVWLFAGFQPFVRLYAEEIEGSIVSPPTRGTRRRGTLAYLARRPRARRGRASRRR